MKFLLEDFKFMGLVPTDDDRRAAAAGISSEASSWLWQFEDSLAASETFGTILEYERGLVASRTELAKLEAAKGQLDAEHNELLAQRGPANGIAKLETKLADASRKIEIVAGRIRKIQTLLEQQFSTAALELRDAFENTFAAAGQEGTAALEQLEGEIRQRVLEPFLQYLRLRTLITMRAQRMQSFRDRLQRGESRQIINEILARRRDTVQPATEAELAETT
jgi:hypothetical protein